MIEVLKTGPSVLGSAVPTRRDGTSRLVYDKVRRTIIREDTGMEWPPCGIPHQTPSHIQNDRSESAAPLSQACEAGGPSNPPSERVR